ncbi:MAG: hypothetical protein AAGT88_06315 [Dethiobacter sp.]
MKKITVTILMLLLVFILALIFRVSFFSCNLATIEGFLETVSYRETIGFTIYRPDYTYYDVPVSDDFLSIWQTDKWKKIRGRWNPDTTIWDEVIAIYIYDGVGIHIENERAVTFDNYALPIIQRRYTLYSIPNEVAVELLAYVLKNVSAKE